MELFTRHLYWSISKKITCKSRWCSIICHLSDKCKDRRAQGDGEEEDEVEERKRPTSASTLGCDCTGKLLFIEAGPQQKNDRYVCIWSPSALTNKHIHMHIEHISSFAFFHFFMIFKQIFLPCEQQPYTVKINPFQVEDPSRIIGLRHRGETKGGQRGVAVCGEVHSLQGNQTLLSLYPFTKVWHSVEVVDRQKKKKGRKKYTSSKWKSKRGNQRQQLLCWRHNFWKHL